MLNDCLGRSFWTSFWALEAGGLRSRLPRGKKNNPVSVSISFRLGAKKSKRREETRVVVSFFFEFSPPTWGNDPI